PTPNNIVTSLSRLVVSPFLSTANNTDLSSVKPSTFRSINSASISSLENSTESSFVLPSNPGRVNNPFGKPTYSLSPFSYVRVKITATYGEISSEPTA